jgi:hypothetical protein
LTIYRRGIGSANTATAFIHETTEHLLTGCNFTEAVWDLVAARYNLPLFCSASTCWRAYCVGKGHALVKIQKG